MKFSPIDIVLLLIIAAYALTGLKRGLLMTIAHTLGNIVAFVVAILGAKALCVPVANAVILPLMRGKLQEAATGVLGAGGTPTPSIDQVWNGLSDSMRQLLGQIGQQKEALLTSGANPIEKLVSAVSANMAQSIAFGILFVLLFCVLSLLLLMFFKTLDFLGKVILLGPLNAIAGAAVGAACGFLICCCALWTLQVFAPALFADAGILSPSKIEHTIVAKKMMEIKPNYFIFKNNYSNVTYGKL